MPVPESGRATNCVLHANSIFFDSAVDALANPNYAISSWGGPYTSSSTTGILSYTIPAPGAIALLGLAGLVGSRKRR